MNFKEWRKNQGLSQTEAAQAIEAYAAEKYPGKSPRKLRQRTLSGWENGALPRVFWLTILREFTKNKVTANDFTNGTLSGSASSHGAQPGTR